MTGLVMAESHVWLNLTEIRQKEKAFLLDAPISSSGLFGNTVNTVVDKSSQSAAFKQFMPQRGMNSLCHSATSVSLPPYLEGPAGSVALDSLYDPVRLHSPIRSQLPVSTGSTRLLSYNRKSLLFCSKGQ